MANLSEDIQCAGSDTRPPMLDRTDFASWQQRIRLYCRGKENGVNILMSIDEGPYQMGTIREPLAEGTEGAPQLGPEQPRVYSDLSPEEKHRYNVDIQATNILLQGLPKDIYTLINHYTDAKTFGTMRVLHDYYVWFAKLINDMRNIKMTMSRMQLNSKFVNNMLPEWGVSNPQRYSPSFSTSSSTQVPQHLADNPHIDSSISPTENLIENLTNTLALLTQSYKTFIPQTNNQLRTSSNVRNQATIQDGRVVVQNGQGRQNRGQGMNPRGGGAAGYGGVQNRVGNVNLGQARPVKCYNCNGAGHIARNCTQPKRPQNSEYYKDKMLLMQAQENGVALDAYQLLFLIGRQDNAFDDDVDEQPVQDLALNVDNVFHADDCDTFDSNMDKAPTTQSVFMANLSSAYPVTDEAGPSYDSDILSEVRDHDHYQDAVCAHHEEHAMHDSVKLNHVVDSHADYTSNSNMIPYDQYVKDNEVPVVHSDVSSIPNDAFMMIYNDIRAKFELTEREQKINEHLRLVISDRNFKEETLKKELHSIKLQLASTIHYNKSMVEEVMFLKKDFKQKENKYLEDFLDMKSIKEKVEDRLLKQDQSLQTVHMLCRPKPYYNELNKVAIGYKNPLCLTRAKKVQPALYNGHEIIKDNHISAIVHNTEDTLEIAEITRKKMNDKMKDSECVTHNVKIAPHDYSKENFLATFTPQKQLTPEQIFWSQDLIKLKSEAVKEQTTVSRPIKALTVITPTGLTEGERGFEQTKECYLKEVIPFFKTLKDNFEGIQKALTKEIKEMKYVFEELEADVAQNVIDRKHDAIERKNLLIANDNLIAECLSKEVFSVATNYELNVARFTENHAANTLVEARCLALEAELANLRDKNSFGNNPPTPDKDTPDFDSVFVIGKMQASLQGKDNVIRQLKKQISPLQVTRSDTNCSLKHYKELYDFIKITRAKHIEQVTALTTENVNLKAQILKKVNSVSKDQVKPKVLARGKYAIDVEPIVPRLRNNRDTHLDYLRHLKESVKTIRDIVEEAKVVRPLDRSIVSACRYIKHSQELLEYAIGTCLQDSRQQDKQLAHIPLIRKKQVTFAKPSDKSNNNTHKHVAKVNTLKTNVPVPSSTGVNSCPNASGSQPKRNTKTNRISPAKGVNKLPVEDQPRTNKSHLRTSNRVDSSSRLKRTVINSNSDSVFQTYNHAPAKVHNTEDTLEIAEITRKKMNAKMTDPECVTHKVKIAPHDYTKENFLATFTPQKQLTPEQIYWSNDSMKLKSEALKERAKVSRPIKAFTV
nr:hypothetical protein [Tanacetum cinerariifolium]